MAFKFIFFTIAFLFSITIQVTPPKVVVYTESYCPDCVRFEMGSFNEFINNPSRSLLAESIEIIPFGNAHELPDSTESNRKFSCQHGEKECYGNKVENCVQSIFGETYDEKFLVCISQQLQESGYSSDFNALTAKCEGEQANVDKIIECAKGKTGDELLHQAALKTGDHQYVPYILINGAHDEKTQGLAEQSLVKFLCQYNGLVGKVEGCKNALEENVEIKEALEITERCINNEFFNMISPSFLSR